MTLIVDYKKHVETSTTEEIISFYRFCIKYVRIACLQEYRQIKDLRYYAEVCN